MVAAVVTDNVLNKDDSAKVIAISQQLLNVVNCGDSAETCLLKIKTFADDAKGLVVGIKDGNLSEIRSNVIQLSEVFEKSKIVGSDVHKARELLGDIIGNVSGVVEDVKNKQVLFKALQDLKSGNIIGLITDAKDLDVTKIIHLAKTTFVEIGAIKDALKSGYSHFASFYKSEILPILNAIEIKFKNSIIIKKLDKLAEHSKILKLVKKSFDSLEKKFNKIVGHEKKVVKIESDDLKLVKDLDVAKVDETNSKEILDKANSITEHASELHVINDEINSVENMHSA